MRGYSKWILPAIFGVVIPALLQPMIPNRPDLLWPLIGFSLLIAIAVVLWELPKNKRVARRPTMLWIGVMTFGFLVYSVGAWFFYVTHRPQEIAGPVVDTPRPEVSQAQFAELRQLSDFIGRDENELREAFDFMVILQKNIAVQNIRIGLRHTGKLNTFKYNNHVEGDGSFIMLAMEGKYHMTPSGPHIDEGPHDVCYLITTTRYQEAQRTIGRFLNSPLIATTIKQTLREYKTTVDNNFELMTRTLNKFMNRGDDFFLKSQEYGGQYYGVIQTDYFSSFQLLKPKADAVVQGIAKYLKTN